MRNKYKKHKNLSLLDPIYNQDQIDELRSNCRLYVHGHSVGGTNPSLVEAMFLGLPSLVFDVNYNLETTNNYAEYFSTENQLNAILVEIWDNKTRLKDIGKNLFSVASNRYKWDSIIKKYRLVIDKSK
jgi:glycosyltransferase involved in cell wall biosynthesis